MLFSASKRRPPLSSPLSMYYTLYVCARVKRRETARLRDSTNFGARWPFESISRNISAEFTDLSEEKRILQFPDARALEIPAPAEAWVYHEAVENLGCPPLARLRLPFRHTWSSRSKGTAAKFKWVNRALWSFLRRPPRSSRESKLNEIFQNRCACYHPRVSSVGSYT